MKFRPCIDVHNGQVKQIVGGSLKDSESSPQTNFISQKDATYYAKLYKEKGLYGGHIIMLNPQTSPYYEDNLNQVFKACSAFPHGLQVGGGINSGNAIEFLGAGASHVIATSYIFSNGEIDTEHLVNICNIVTKKHLVLDLSCRKLDGEYYIVTNRWQKFTKMKLDVDTLSFLSKYCDEFLIHGVDSEGKSSGIEEDLVKTLGSWGKIPVTYAGGISTYEDLNKIETLGNKNLDFTVGSALDIFGGELDFDKIAEYK